MDDVDFSGVRNLDVELQNEPFHLFIAAFVRDDDESVRAFIGDDLADSDFFGASVIGFIIVGIVVSAISLDLENLCEEFFHIGDGGILNLIDP